MSVEQSFAERMIAMVMTRDERVGGLETLLAKAVKERMEAERRADRNLQGLHAALDQLARYRTRRALMRRVREGKGRHGTSAHGITRCRLASATVQRSRVVVVPTLELIDVRRRPPEKVKRRGNRKSPPAVQHQTADRV